EDVDRHDVDLEQLLDRLLDLELIGIRVDAERVLAALGLVHRLLADDRPQHDLRSHEGHAYTSAIVDREGWVMSSVSALMTSTTLSESARMIETPGRLRAESARFCSSPWATTRTRPDTLSAPRHVTRSRVLGSSKA